ncbi:hypothetical protein POF50_002585 [Streptomyces sp. SL13]|uniref:Uncharacterized protein n=1 Tax=Streptantibioticus silvisoli TaxID=2705255 RepID=A0AA90GZJ7_9ACTN|nr:hypothetical protein [Streptantibioticus silvisoli]MDI5968243.1 hypothetical protein [Streptantibioticus silvisoli]
MPAERAVLLERGAGLSPRELRELAATEEGERRVRALLTAPAPGPLDVVPLDASAMDQLLDALGEDNRAALAARHLDLDVLRRMCAIPEGLAFVRALVAPPALVTYPEVLPDRPQPPATGRRVATAWLLVVAGALAGVALCMGISALIGGAAFLVGIIYLIFGLTILFLKVPETRGQSPAAGLVALAFSVLMVVASFSVSDWYLAVRGVPEHVTVVPPAHYRERGGDVPVCQVRYADGSVRRVATNDAGCAQHDVGSRTTVMTDPAGWFAPHLGTAADLNLAETGSVAGAAGALLVIAPLSVVVMAAADRRRRGTRGDA